MKHLFITIFLLVHIFLFADENKIDLIYQEIQETNKLQESILSKFGSGNIDLMYQEIQETNRLQEVISKKLDNNASKSDSSGTVIGLCGIVIGMVGLLFTVSTLYSFFTNKKIYAKAQKNLEISKQQIKDLKNKKDELVRDIDIYKDNLSREMDLLKTGRILEYLLRTGNNNPDEIFPLLSQLVDNPNLMDLGLFNKLLELNINEEINKLANQGKAVIREDISE